ncbi:hypothetical protein [Aeromicrobium sp.]|uniref:hypothetical protein n=1 Tax=Aeromicrobium sp. TaxID=1871063 RepID=UPI00199C1443|nr:hypothetical protein [Aeromicrobium sp.]MBC7631781.1 hypothetical protein [Aeromicrobium sp.]
MTDHPEPPPELILAMQRRADVGAVQFRVIVPNPAQAELHLLHPERHEKAREAEQVLLSALPELEVAAGGRVLGSVSVRHDPMDAIEETLFSEPIDEIILAVAPHGLATRLHLDLAHRLQHFGLPITVITNDDIQQ